MLIAVAAAAAVAVAAYLHRTVGCMCVYVRTACASMCEHTQSVCAKPPAVCAEYVRGVPRANLVLACVFSMCADVRVCAASMCAAGTPLRTPVAAAPPVPAAASVTSTVYSHCCC